MRWRRWPVIICCLALGAVAAQESGPEKPAERLFAVTGIELPDPPRVSGPVTHLWIVKRYTDDRFSLLHRQSSDPPGQVFTAFEARGRVAGVAADGPRLYLAFEGRTVQSVEFYAPPPPQPPGYRTIQIPALPSDAALLSFSAGPTGVRALVQGPSPATRRAQAPATGAGLRLLRLSGLVWEEEPLPEGLSSGNDPRVISNQDLHSGPIVLTTPREGELVVYRASAPSAQPGRWISQRYAFEPGEQRRFLTLTHNGSVHLIMGVAPAGGEGSASIYTLRDGDLTPLGAVAQPPGSWGKWWALPANDGVVLLSTDDAQQFRTALQAFPSGRVSQWTTLSLAQRTAPWGDPITMAVIAAVVIGTMVLLVSGRRQTQPAPMRLPAGVRPAVIHRVAAAAVDFSPGLAASMIYYGLTDPSLVLIHLAERPAAPEDLKPFLLAVGVHVAHTGLTELLTGSTLGKAICGCRVVDFSGGRPRPWQVVTRNVFKGVEMLMPFFLLLPVMSPTFQRLGDVLARTLVVWGGGRQRDRSVAGAPDEPDEG